MAITRNTDGFSTVVASDPLGNFAMLDPTKWAVFYDDFLAYDVTQLIGGNPYLFTQTNCVDTVVGPTGVLLLTCGGADNDLGQLQTVTAPFTIVAGQKAFFEARVRVDRATGTIGQEEIVIGMTGLETGASFTAADGLSVAFNEGIAFTSYDGAATWNAVARVADVESVDAAITTYADLTFQTLSWYYDGTDIRFYVNNSLEATLTTGEPTLVIAPVVFIKAGEAQAKVLHVDYVLAAFERVATP